MIAWVREMYRSGSGSISVLCSPRPMVPPDSLKRAETSRPIGCPLKEITRIDNIGSSSLAGAAAGPSPGVAWLARAASQRRDCTPVERSGTSRPPSLDLPKRLFSGHLRDIRRGGRGHGPKETSMSASESPSRALTFEDLPKLRTKTEAVSKILQEQLTSHLETLRPILSPERLFGKHVGARLETPMGDRALAQVQQSYRPFAARPFDLPAEFDPYWLTLVGNRVTVYP